MDMKTTKELDKEGEKPSEKELKKARGKSKKGRMTSSKKKHEKEILLPDFVLMGFQEGSARKDLDIYLRSKAAGLSDGNADNAFYQVIKKDGGFYWEIHDSGSGKGALKSVLSLMKTQDEVVVRSSRRWLKVTKPRNSKGITGFLLSEDNDKPETKEVIFSDPMKSMSSTGTGFMVFSMFFAFLGVLVGLSGIYFKYGFFNEFEREVELKPVDVIPTEKIGALRGYLLKNESGESTLDGKYIEAYNFENGQFVPRLANDKDHADFTPESSEESASNDESSIAKPIDLKGLEVLIDKEPGSVEKFEVE